MVVGIWWTETMKMVGVISVNRACGGECLMGRGHEGDLGSLGLVGVQMCCCCGQKP